MTLEESDLFQAALELIANARELRHTVACWDKMHWPIPQECSCARRRLPELFERFTESNDKET